jgi:hypothetical protein
MSRGARAAILLAATALALAASAGCKPKAGSSCKAGESTCADKTTALTCRDGKLAEVPCAGPLGCAKIRERAQCDTSIANDGDAGMAEDDEEYACTPDKTRALTCEQGRFRRYLECRGKGGCTLLGRTVSCDTSVAADGDPCRVQGAVACGANQKQMFVCRDGTFQVYRHCRGQYGCYLKGDAPTCDETLSLEGDPCGLPGYVVCAVDGKNELVCQGGRFQTSRACRKSGCVVTNRPGRPIACD